MYTPEDFVDPRDVDWTSGFNPLRVPGWRRTVNKYAWSVMHDAFLQSLDKARGIEPRAYVCPDASQQLIQPGITFDYEVPSEPNLWIWGINASAVPAVDESDVATNFLFTVRDSVTGAQLFTSPVPMSDFNATRSGTANRGPICLLSTPHLYRAPAYPVVRIINANNDPNSTPTALNCRVTLFGCVEYDV